MRRENSILGSSGARAKRENVLIGSSGARLAGLTSGEAAIELNLTSIADIETHINKYSGSFECSDEWYVKDFDGVYHPVIEDTPSIHRNRQVTNLALYSNDLSNAAWTKSAGVTITGTNQFQADSTNDVVSQDIVTIEDGVYRMSFDLYIVSGPETGAKFYHLNSATGGTTSIPIETISGTSVRYSVEFLGKTGGGVVKCGFQDVSLSNFPVFNISNIHIERILSEENTNPSDSILTTDSTVTEAYTVENLNVSYNNIVRQRILGNYPNGGAAIGDSQTDNANSYSILLNGLMDGTVSNEGISGNTLQTIAARFVADVDPANKDFAIIQGGINNLNSAATDPNSTMRAAIESMVADCVANSCEPIFINVSPWSTNVNWNADRQAWTESYNTWLAAYCVTNGYFRVDVYSLLADPADPTALSSDYDGGGDGLHWNIPADALIGETLATYFRTTVTATSVPIAEIGLATAPYSKNYTPVASYRDFTHANWTPTNGSITAGNVILIDGTIVADKNTLTASGANCTLIHDAYVSASGVHSAGVFIKRKTGTGAIEVCVDGSTWVDVTTQVDFASKWHLCQTTLPTVTDPQVGVRLVTSGDAVYLDWAQLDAGRKYVSNHPVVGDGTCSGFQFIAADANNVRSLVTNDKGAIYVEFQLLPENGLLGSARLVQEITSPAGILFYVDSVPPQLRNYDRTSVLVLSGQDLGSFTRAVSYWNNSTKYITANGGNTVSGNYDGEFGSGDGYLAVGGQTPGVSVVNGYMKKVVFYPNYNMSQTTAESLTTTGF